MTDLPAFRISCRCGDPARPPKPGIVVPAQMPQTCAACKREDDAAWKRDYNAKRPFLAAAKRATRPPPKPKSVYESQRRRALRDASGLVPCPRGCGRTMLRLTVEGNDRVACAACLEADRDRVAKATIASINDARRKEQK